MLNSFSPGSVDHINRICRYLALDDFDRQPISAQTLQARFHVRKLDFIVVFGNQVLTTIRKACDLMAEGIAERLLLTGGIGHSTQLLFQNISESPRFGHLVASGMVSDWMPEADMFAAIVAAEVGILPSSILVENKSTNTGENARFSLDLIRARMREVSSVLLIQDPIMQRRTVLTMSQAVRSLPKPPLLLSHSVFVPQIHGGQSLIPPDSVERSPWDPTRFLGLVLGEIKRIRNDEQGYGPKGRGFIAAEEIPEEVLASYEYLSGYATGR